MAKKIARIAAAGLTFLLITLGCLLFVPPIRDQFFYTNLWPWPLATDITPAQIEHLRKLAEPGDVIVETNMHYWQWVALSFVTTNSTWVHTALVEDKSKLLSVNKQVKELPYEIYLTWNSTRMALVRPPYKTPEEVDKAVAYGRSKIGTMYDPSFKNPNASCTGIVGESLRHAGLNVPRASFLGTPIYPAAAFIKMPAAKLVWISDK